MILPQRQTALVAKQCAELARLSNNRFRLGIGVGWNHVEYDALGQDFTIRGKRSAEQIQLLRMLWSKELVSFDGTYDSVERAAIVPRPTEPIEIWLGGFSDVALKRAAMLGDGFIFAGSPRTVNEQWARVRQLVEDNDRDPDTFGAEYALDAKTPDSAAEKAAAWRDAGGTHCSIVSMNKGFASVDEHLQFFETVASELRDEKRT